MRILLIEDDAALSEVITYALEAEGSQVDWAAEGDDGLRWMRERTHDLVLLDRMLPRLDGAALLRRARGEGIGTPVLMLTAMGQVRDKVEGLDAGADDYIVKPFAIEELCARVRAMGRRPKGWAPSPGLRFGGTEFDPERNLLLCEGRQCGLSRREAALLEMFFRNPGQTIPRATLFSRVWGPDAPVEEGNLENYVHFARRRLRSVGSGLQLTTVRGVGYRMEESGGV